MAPLCLAHWSFVPAIKVCMYLLTVKPLQNFKICDPAGTCGQTKIPSGKRLHNELENHHAIHG